MVDNGVTEPNDDERPTAEQIGMVEQAIKETVCTIREAAEARNQGDETTCVVLSHAIMRWRQRYYPMFQRAVENGRIWDEDKEMVLERARQVGVIAASMASFKATVFAWIRGEIGRPGQYVHVGRAPTPEVTAGIAELAARCVDCWPSEDHVNIQWDWCSTGLAPELLGFRKDVSKPPTIREVVDFLRDEAADTELERCKRLGQGMKARKT